MTVDDDGELHGVHRAETHQSMQRHHWFIRIGGRGGAGVLCILVVADLDVEEALAAVATNILFIVVVAEPCLRRLLSSADERRRKGRGGGVGAAGVDDDGPAGGRGTTGLWAGGRAAGRW
jgi:hypothetical protein